MGDFQDDLNSAMDMIRTGGPWPQETKALWEQLQNAHLDSMRRRIEMRDNGKYRYVPEYDPTVMLIGGAGDGNVLKIQHHLMIEGYRVVVLDDSAPFASLVEEGPPTYMGRPIAYHLYKRRNVVMFDDQGGSEFDEEMEDLPSSQIVFMVWDGKTHYS